MNALTEFTPVASLIGGALIGLASVMLMVFKGRIAGVSGIVVRLFPPYEDGELLGRVAFLAGLIGAPALVAYTAGTLPPQTIVATAPVLLLAGLLVGFGSVWGNGCTSGHGVCGLSRLSMRSLVAVCTFMGTAIMTVFFVRHVI
jgi:uncharacterized membrane protein YedE/YeeE